MSAPVTQEELNQVVNNLNSNIINTGNNLNSNIINTENNLQNNQNSLTIQIDNNQEAIDEIQTNQETINNQIDSNQQAINEIQTNLETISEIQTNQEAINSKQEIINSNQETINSNQETINSNQETINSKITSNQEAINEIQNPPPLFYNKNETFELHGTSWSNKVTCTLKSFLVISGGTINVSNVKFVKDPLTTQPVGIIILADGNENQFTDFDNTGIDGLKSIPYGSKVGSGNSMIDCDLILENSYGLNALTLVNLGTDNVFNSIYVKNSGDDGIEILGGSVNMSHITVEDAKDDFVDVDEGHTGTIMGLKLISSNKINKSLIECGKTKPLTETKFLDVSVYVEDVRVFGDLGGSKAEENTSDLFRFRENTKCELNGKLMYTEEGNDITPISDDILPDNKILFVPENFEYKLYGTVSHRKTYNLDKIIVVKGNIIFKNINIIEDPTTTNPTGILILAEGSDKTFSEYENLIGQIPYGSTEGRGNSMVNCDLINLGDFTKELNAFTLVNLGTDNVFNNIYVKNSGDDGIEILEGSVNMSHITVEDAKDDFVDTDEGHTGTIHGLKLISSNLINKSLIECGKSEPTTETTFLDVSVYVKDERVFGDLGEYKAEGNNSDLFRFRENTKCELNDEIRYIEENFGGEVYYKGIANDILP